MRGVEVASIIGLASATRPTVNDEDRSSFGVP